MRYAKEVAWRLSGDVVTARRYLAEARVVAGEVLTANTLNLEQIEHRVILAPGVTCRARALHGQVIIEIHAAPQKEEDRRVSGFIVDETHEVPAALVWNSANWVRVPESDFTLGLTGLAEDNQIVFSTARHSLSIRGSRYGFRQGFGQSVYLDGRLLCNGPSLATLYGVSMYGGALVVVTMSGSTYSSALAVYYRKFKTTYDLADETNEYAWKQAADSPIPLEGYFGLQQAVLFSKTGNRAVSLTKGDSDSPQRAIFVVRLELSGSYSSMRVEEFSEASEDSLLEYFAETQNYNVDSNHPDAVNTYQDCCTGEGDDARSDIPNSHFSMASETYTETSDWLIDYAYAKQILAIDFADDTEVRAFGPAGQNELSTRNERREVSTDRTESSVITDTVIGYDPIFGDYCYCIWSTSWEYNYEATSSKTASYEDSYEARFDFGEEGGEFVLPVYSLVTGVVSQSCTATHNNAGTDTGCRAYGGCVYYAPSPNACQEAASLTQYTHFSDVQIIDYDLRFGLVFYIKRTETSATTTLYEIKLRTPQETISIDEIVIPAASHYYSATTTTNGVCPTTPCACSCEGYDVSDSSWYEPAGEIVPNVYFHTYTPRDAYVMGHDDYEGRLRCEEDLLGHKLISANVRIVIYGDPYDFYYTELSNYPEERDPPTDLSLYETGLWYDYIIPFGVRDDLTT